MAKKKRQLKKAKNKEATQSARADYSLQRLVGELARTIQPLKERFEKHKENLKAKGGDPYSDPFCLRIRRALSWAESAAQTNQEEDDIAFICLWIAFNAAYANYTGEEIVGESTEKERFQNFFEDLESADTQKYRGSASPLYNVVWNELFGKQGDKDEIPIFEKVLLNKYLFHLFWIDQHQVKYENKKIEIREPNGASIRKAISSQDTAAILSEIFVRLYTLRNQLMHGNATWKSSVNREQVEIGRAVLEKLLPVLFEVMIDNPERFAGKPFCPVVYPVDSRP